ncbi:phage portal protein [Bartonella sp. HY329]|uniref:phage portal protein n=1 Tax=unclassified Bartonella TaxID=2645622 RepID=UPI0021C7479C|nr:MULTISPECIES: phage portal protein [unclassified Bartonella]UXM94027.1 phage portal protein [Bartonella sp. HY329]UXN08349.1 phage portal protein [Bartonella sp. HY328]
MQQEKPRIRVKAGSRKLNLETRNMPKAGYLRGEPGFAQSIGSFKGTPVLRDRADDISVAWYAANARANDASINSGWIAGAVEQIVTSMIGSGLRLNAKPDLTCFKWNKEETSSWARLVETRWGMGFGFLRM